MSSVKYLIIVGIICHSGITKSHTGGIIVKDYNALIEFYNSTDGPNWKNHTNWGSSEPVSTWYGVSVAGDRVYSLDLRKNRLKGSIPAVIGNLDQMRHLLLLDNKLSGSLPSEIEKLKELTLLHLWRNELSGNIPIELFNATNLRTLDLSYNYLSGGLPKEISNLSNLDQLSLSNNSLTGEIPTEIGSLSKLRFLYLGENQWEGEIPKEIGELSLLEVFQVAWTSISGPIPEELGNCLKLRTLHLVGNKLSGTFPPALGQLSSLEVLDLAYNQLSGPIPDELGNLFNLIKLALSNNQISGTIPKQLGQLTNLTFLSLQNNQLTGPIPEEIGNLLNLSELSFSFNQLTGRIPKQIGQLNKLGGLYLSQNNLTGSLPEEIKYLESLQRLFIDRNMLTDLPDLSESAKLTNLYCSNNLLTFEDLEQNMSIDSIYYYPQKRIPGPDTINLIPGEKLHIKIPLGGTSTQYQWFKQDNELQGENTDSLVIKNIGLRDQGIYHLEAINALVPGLVLRSEDIIVNVNPNVTNVQLEKQMGKDQDLLQNYPNPFSSETIIEYQLPVTSKVILRIYNTFGNQIRILVNSEQNKGVHKVIWDGNGETGNRVPSGLYLYQIDAVDFLCTKSLLVK